MKINDIHRIGAVNQYNKQSARAKDGLDNKQKRDEVQISAEALELLQTQGIESRNNEARIQELKQSVENGTYSVDSRKIAEKLLPYLQDR